MTLLRPVPFTSLGLPCWAAGPTSSGPVSAPGSGEHSCTDVDVVPGPCSRADFTTDSPSGPALRDSSRPRDVAAV